MSTVISKTGNPLQRFIRPGDLGTFGYERSLIQNHWPRVLRVLQGKPTPPYEIEIQPSSSCNIHCIWCIGESIQAANEVTRLSNEFTKPKRGARDMLKLTNGIADYRVREEYTEGGTPGSRSYRVETVKFSGFIGEPLVAKEATLVGMRNLAEHDIRVGLFTNGVLMDKSTWDVITDANFLHLSLDSGTPETFAFLKCRRKVADERLFGVILSNLEGVAQLKARKSSKMDLNVGYVINPYNYLEVFDIAKRLKETGINYFRVKIDISGGLPLSQPMVGKARDLLGEIKTKLVGDGFNLVETHALETEEQQTKRCFSKCFAHFLWGTIGSDGNVYPCDHNTYPGAPHYGNAINKPFGEIWGGAMRQLIIRGLPLICPPTCSPFANRVNPFLSVVRRILSKEDLGKLETYRSEILGAGR